MKKLFTNYKEEIIQIKRGKQCYKGLHFNLFEKMDTKRLQKKNQDPALSELFGKKDLYYMLDTTSYTKNLRK